MSKQQLAEVLEQAEARFAEMALKIWEHPQIAYEETYASELQQKALEEAGFRIQSAIGGVPTAFMAEYGSGSPLIGILGEFDALPGLSQSTSTRKDPLVANGPGHGCGHHLLGTAGAEAVMGLKSLIDEGHLTGTIRYYGCPAEEVLSGKTFMAREGVFDDLDCCFTWHPGTSNVVQNYSTQAMISIKYQFKGIPAHAAGAPHAGRSALDAVEIMNIGANYLREHLVDGTRIHYAITNGGMAPNIVPEEAEVWYYLRGASREQVDGMLKRMNDIAEGAALITGTSYTSDLLANCYHTLANNVMSEVMYQNMLDYEMQPFSDEEKQYAESLLDSIDPAVVKESRARISSKADQILPTSIHYDEQLKGMTMPGSTDVADVSWITPLATIGTTCGPVGTQVHSWQATAVFGTSIGLKGMHYAAKIMAMSVYDMITNEDLLKQAKAEFMEATKENPYQAGLSADVLPPVLEKTAELV